LSLPKPLSSVSCAASPYNTPGVKNTQASINGGMDVKIWYQPKFHLRYDFNPRFWSGTE